MFLKSLPVLFLGIFAGVFGGALGQSGSVILLPGLLLLGIVPNFKTAVGTVLLTILPPLSLLAVYEYYRRGEILVKTSIILMVTYFFAAYLGAYLTRNIENRFLQGTSGVSFILIGLFFLWNAYTQKYNM